MFFKKAHVSKESANTMTATFWGASDRMICCKGIGGEGNEFNTTTHPKLAAFGYIATLQISSPTEDQGLLIHTFYSGHWSFAVSPSDEESDELPDWEMVREWGTVNSHSETLKISCPEDAEVKVVDRIRTSVD